MANTRHGMLALTAAFGVALGSVLGSDVSVDADQPVWYPVTIDFQGPEAGQMDSSPNPFLDYRLQVTFDGPSGQSYNVPGYFDGDGKGGPKGNVWAREVRAGRGRQLELQGLFPQRPQGGHFARCRCRLAGRV